MGRRTRAYKRDLDDVELPEPEPTSRYMYIGGSYGPGSGWEWARASYTRATGSSFGMNFQTPDELESVEWIKMYYCATTADIVSGKVSIAYAVRGTGDSRGYDGGLLDTPLFNLPRYQWDEIDLWGLVYPDHGAEPDPGDHVTFLVTNSTGQTIQILSCMMKVIVSE